MDGGSRSLVSRSRLSHPRHSLIFGVSLLFAYLLWPLIRFVDRRLPGHSRGWALAIVYTSLVALFIVLGILIGSLIVGQATVFATKVQIRFPR